MPPKRNVSYIKPAEPAFIKRMKEAIGYQEPATVDTKREVRAYDENQEEQEDEKPVVVVLKPGDVTEEEYKVISEKADVNKKVTFSKPVKKEMKSSLDFTSRKKEELQKKISSQRENSKKVKNSSLLSFDEDEDF